MKRRNAIKSVSAALLAPIILRPVLAGSDEPVVVLPSGTNDSEHIRFDKPLTCIIIGAGNRGWTYSLYASAFPGQMKIVGIAEPVKIRQEKFRQAYNLDEKNIFDTWERVFERPKFADFVIVSTIDKHHYGAAMQALEMGYHVLLEKAIAQSWEQCREILEQSVRYSRIVGICHVMRYSPYYIKMREVVQAGEIGEVVSMQHLEPVGNIHFSHSFVRGNCGNEKESTPSLLSKSCHDLDIIYWILGKKCKLVTSFGGLAYFRAEHAPAGGTAQCTGGCAIEKTCPYSAKRIYLTERIWDTGHLIDLQPWEEGKVLKAIQEGPYGRCVFHCDNDVADHQVVNMEFENGITVSFNMEAHTGYMGRKTRIMGTDGDIEIGRAHV